jgi:hypothetical protein
VAATAVVLVVLGGLTARLFVWPTTGAPAHADAIVMFNGDGDRLDKALALAWSHVAPRLVIARGSTYWAQGNRCAPAIPGVTVTCFDPSPSTTQGEAEFAGRLAEAEGWHSIILVTTRPQATRARLRLERCFPGRISIAAVHLSQSRSLMAVGYEWAATIKAEVFQRSC